MKEKKLQRLRVKLFLLIFFILLINCQKERRENFFYTYMQSDPAKLDPFYSTDVISGRVMAKLFNGLFRIDKNGNITEDLTESYTFDGTQLILNLKKNVLFHNRKKLTSDDVIFSFERIQKSENPTSPRKWVFSNIKSIKKINRYRLQIYLYKPSSTFLYLLTMPNCYIISKEGLINDKKIIGTGPFLLEEWEQDQYIVLKKNSDYYGAPPDINGIVFKIIPEDLTARFEFLNNTLDYFELPYLSKVKLQRNDLKIEDVPELSVHYIAFNTEKYPFNIKSFRSAMNMAINRQEIIKKLFNNRFKVAFGPVPPVVGSYKSKQKKIHYDLSKSQKIINELGLNGKTYTLFIKSDHQVSIISQMLQSYLNKTGLNIKIREMEWSALKAAAMKGKFDMCYFTWHADYPEAENFLFPLFYSGNRGAGGNRSFYNNKEVDRLLLMAKRTVTERKRFDIYHNIEKLIVEDSPWIFLWYGDKRIMLSSRVKGFVPYQIYHGMKGNEIILQKQIIKE